VYVIQSDQPFMYPKVVDQRRVVPKKWNPLGHAPYFFNYFGKDEVPFLIRGPHLDLKLRRMLIEKPQKVKAGGRWVDRNQEPKFSDRPQKFVGFEAAAALCYSRGEHEPLNLELLHEKLDERRTGRATHFRIPRSPDEVLIELMGYSARDRLEGGVPFASARVRQLLIAAAQGVQRHGKKVSVVADVEEGSEITVHTHRNYDGREGHVMRIAAADLLSNLIRLELDRGR
jgi:hypothetical protein